MNILFSILPYLAIKKTSFHLKAIDPHLYIGRKEQKKGNRRKTKKS